MLVLVLVFFFLFFTKKRKKKKVFLVFFYLVFFFLKRKRPKAQRKKCGCFFLFWLPIKTRRRPCERGIVSMVEQWSPKPEVKGSNPFSPDLFICLFSVWWSRIFCFSLVFLYKKTREKQKIRDHQTEKRQINRSGEKGFEPLTSGFGDHCSTIETIPLSQGLRLVFIGSQKRKKQPHFFLCAFGLFLFKKKKTK